MKFIHFDEAKQAAIAAVRAWVSEASPDVRVLLIVDLFGKQRLVLWSKSVLETTGLEKTLADVCGAWWTHEFLRFQGGDPEISKVYDDAWDLARLDEGEPRFRLNDRHRSRTAWFSKAVEPIWKVTEKDPPVVVFYSFKGGLGRSTLLASFAIQRAHAGERVCVVDFDLDSPGAGRLLSNDASGLTARWGVVDFLLERSLPDTLLADYFHRCDRVAGDGEIIVFPAGKLDEDYADKLARIDLEEEPQPHESGLSKLLTRVRDELKPRWILLDARTGISETGGQLLSGIAHLHVLLGTTLDQSWQGMNLVLNRLGKDRVLSERPQAELLLVQAMVPSGKTGEDARKAFAACAEEAFDGLYYAEEEIDDDSESPFWTLGDKENQDAPHVPMPINYDSGLSSFGDISEVDKALCGELYIKFAERIINRFLPEPTT